MDGEKDVKRSQYDVIAELAASVERKDIIIRLTELSEEGKTLEQAIKILKGE